VVTYAGEDACGPSVTPADFLLVIATGRRVSVV